MKKLNTSDIILIFIGVALVLFTIVNISLFCTYGHTPDVLITCVFTACTGEISALAALRANKRKYDNMDINNSEGVG